MRSMLLFAVPMILGNLLQQCYNIADTMIVGQCLGKHALAAVGSSFTLMTFLTSILLGLCMGSGALFSIRFGQRDEAGLRESVCASFLLIAAATLLLNGLAFACLDGLRVFLQVPAEVWGLMREYLAVIFCGIAATFLYNYFASFLRAVGNSVVPLVFLAVSAVLNIALDLWFVMGLRWGVRGTGNGHCPVCLRHRHRHLRAGAVSPAAGHPQSLPHPLGLRQGNRWFLRPDLRPTVRDESGHSHGAGAGQQLWSHHHGRICCRSKGRCLRLYAGTGFRKRFFYLYLPELRSKKRRPDTKRT